MLDALKFVQGAVAKKDFVPTLNHFQIKDGKVLGFNGSLALCSPIDLDLDVTPKALPFVKAVETCRDTVAMHVTPAGRLAVKSGKFKAYIECTGETFPDVEPEGDYVALDGELLPALKKVSPFIAQDASRPWATGILFRGESAFATNNIIMVEQWLGYRFPITLNIPIAAIKELLRIKEEPTGMRVTDTSITFLYENGRWLRSQLSALAWPDFDPVLNRPSNQVPIPDGFFQAVADIEPFADELGRVYFTGDSLSTNLDGTGATVDIPILVKDACFQAKQLLNLEGYINTVDFSCYPNPCPFFGDNFRGVIIGMRL